MHNTGDIFEEKFRNIAIQFKDSITDPNVIFSVLPKEGIPGISTSTLTDNDLVIKIFYKNVKITHFISIQATEQNPTNTKWIVDVQNNFPHTAILGSIRKDKGILNKVVAFAAIPNGFRYPQFIKLSTKLKYSGSEEDFLSLPKNDFLKAMQVGAYYVKLFIEQHVNDRRPPSAVATPVVLCKQPIDNDWTVIAAPATEKAFLAEVFSGIIPDTASNIDNICTCFLLSDNEDVFKKFLSVMVDLHS